MREHRQDSFGLGVENSKGGPFRISMLKKKNLRAILVSKKVRASLISRQKDGFL